MIFTAAPLLFACKSEKEGIMKDCISSHIPLPYEAPPAAAKAANREEMLLQAVEDSVMHGLFGSMGRRSFLKALGAGAAATLVGGFFPLDAAKALALDATGPVEKADVRIGFMPITCGTPIIMAQPMGFYKKYGLSKAQLMKASGWAMIRDWGTSGQTDYSQMLAPMPIAMSMGLGSSRQPFIVPVMENVNGQAITLRNDHKNVTGPQDMKGFVFAVPFDYSVHNLLLRYYLAEGGVDPDKEVQIRVLPPPEMVANMMAGNLDGYLSPDPFNQRAVHENVGFIFKLTHEIWPGHPCCVFTSSERFAQEAPNTFKAIVNALLDATAYSSEPANRKEIARLIAVRNYLNQPVEVVEQVLTGYFPDGLGNTMNVPERINFDPFPYHSFAVWIMTQLKRWGYIKQDVDYRQVAEQVFRAADCADAMRGMGMTPPSETCITHTIMGKTFDPADPEAYLDSFALKRQII